MITKNFKALIATILQGRASASPVGMVPIINYNGDTKYMAPYFVGRYPAQVATAVQFSVNAGIWIGSGNTPPSENDHALVSQITSGLSATAPSITTVTDADGNPVISFVITLTNTTSSDIIVREVGYAQVLAHSNSLNQTGSNLYSTYLLDRTVLDTPLTVPANGNAVLKYELKTVIS